MKGGQYHKQYTHDKTKHYSIGMESVINDTGNTAAAPDKRIALLLSGGVDSAVVLHLLCEQGMKPDCFYIKIGMYA